MQEIILNQVPKAPVSNSQRVYDATKDHILSGAHRGGQLLSEVEVAETLGVSRTPVHEAFLRLATEGLMDLLPRRGAIVVPFTPQDATEILEMRLALETASVRRLCQSTDVTERLFIELDGLLDEQRRVAADDDRHSFAAVDDAFHRRIVEAAGNSIAIRFYGSLTDRQRRMITAAAQANTAGLAVLIDDHRQLAAAIARRNFAEFEVALLAHLEATYSVALR